jgi:hypothetical protein
VILQGGRHPFEVPPRAVPSTVSHFPTSCPGGEDPGA